MNDYTIIYVSDRAKENISSIRSALSSWSELTDNRAVHGKKENAFKILRDMGFRFNYEPDDGRIEPMMPTEAGVFASHIFAMKNALNHNCDIFTLFEDDALISEDFVAVHSAAIADAPAGWDFISMIAMPEMNDFSEISDIGSSVIHRCVQQPSYLACMIYSNSGINKFINHILDVGIYYNVDSILYRASHSGVLNGYILRNEYSYAVRHDPSLIKSDIDPQNKRNM